MHSTHSRTLLLLRHGKAQQDMYHQDFERSLIEKGYRNTTLIASYMQQHDLHPDFILSSPSIRTMQTTEIICECLGLNSNNIHTNGDIYEASCNDLINILSTLPESSNTVLLVGHNPGLEYLIDYLHPTPAMDRILYPSSLAQIEIEDEWSKLNSSSGRLISITHAKLLIDKN